MTLRSEVLALTFGALLILVTFGDSHVGGGRVVLGNLDSIFDLTFWRALDLVYFLAPIAIFLLYGWTKGDFRLRFNAANALFFASFLAVLTLFSVDDFAIVLRLPLELPTVYWAVMSWVFPVYFAFAFFMFGRENQREKQPGPQG
jgi:hypothetical protein